MTQRWGLGGCKDISLILVVLRFSARQPFFLNRLLCHKTLKQADRGIEW